MKYLTYDIIKALKPAEEYFRQVSVGYKRNSPHALDVQVYEALKSINPNEPKPNYSCSKCIYELYKTLSTYYFKSIEKNNQDKTHKEDGHNSEPKKEPKRKGKKKRSP